MLQLSEISHLIPHFAPPVVAFPESHIQVTCRYDETSLMQMLREGSKRFTLAPPNALANSISSATICHANGVICPILATSSRRGSLRPPPTRERGGRPRRPRQGATQPNPILFLREGGRGMPRSLKRKIAPATAHGEFGCKREKCIEREERNGRNGRVYTELNHRRPWRNGARV